MVKILILLFSHLIFICIGVVLGRSWHALISFFKMKRYRKNEAMKSPDVLYKNLQEYFAREKPYLDSQLDIKYVAKRLLTNRTYLARAIKENGGVNFNYFVNSYRIREAIDIFRMDPLARVGETATKIGFNSSSAFTMAFKIYVNMTPKQWKDYYMFTSVSRLDKPAGKSSQPRKGRSGRTASGR